MNDNIFIDANIIVYARILADRQKHEQLINNTLMIINPFK